AAEDPTGAIVDLRRRGARVPANPLRRPVRTLPRPNPESLAATVSILRRVASTPLGGVRVDSAVAIALLQQAALHGHEVLIGYVDAAGVATQRAVRPLAVRGGQLIAWDSTQGRPREFALHRVTSVIPSESG
ncbi:MAG: DNA-binding protein, partial [Mycobacterium sp.]|nr:DNA-binding protein [Mycobacterium sp.]